MTNILIKTSTILSLIVPLILLSISQSSQLAISASTNHIDDHVKDIDDDDEESYILDEAPPTANVRSRSRFLASYIIKRGTHCDPVKYNICNGVRANKGKSLLYCCKTHCRNILGDRNNCGQCGHKCNFGERCCNGSCTNVLFNENHCGKCDKQCKAGVACDNGYCGYA